jgi:hypothetical protein
MNPEVSPDAPPSALRATVLDGLITCPHCSGWIESSTDHAGQIVACPHCAGHFQLPEPIELGFVPPPVQWGGSTPSEPWFYGFIDTYAKAWMWISLLVGTLGFLGAAAASVSLTTRAARVGPGVGPAWIGNVLLLATIVAFASWLLGILLSVAFMLLAVDIGRNLRAIRHQTPDRGRGNANV